MSANNRWPRFSVDQLVRIAEALGLTPEDLLYLMAWEYRECEAKEAK